MLQKMHDHMKGIVTVVLFGLLAVVFIFWGINRDVVSAQSYAIKVNKKKFTAEQVRDAYQRNLAQLEQRFQQELPPAARDEVRANTVESMIEHELLLQRTTDLHYRVSTEDIDRLFKTEPAFQVNGKFDLLLAQRVLASNRMTIAGWEKDKRETAQVTQLYSGLVGTQFVMPAELARSAALELEQREMSYAVIPAARFVAAVAPKDAEIQAYFDAHKGEFMTDETITLQYVELKRDDIATPPVTEMDLKKYYAETMEKYKHAERRRARHILISVTRPEDDAAGLKKANEIFEKLKGGANFAALAKQYSSDVTTQPSGGDLDWREAGGLEAELDKAVFAMKPDELHAPIRSKFGYEVLRLEIVAHFAETQLACRVDRVEAQDFVAELAADRRVQLIRLHGEDGLVEFRLEAAGF